MKRVASIALIVVVTSLFGIDQADAAPRVRFRLFARGYSSNGPVAFGAPTFPHNYGTRYRSPSVDELYPKYYGGFHYRHLDNIGIPRAILAFAAMDCTCRRGRFVKAGSTLPRYRPAACSAVFERKTRGINIGTRSRYSAYSR